MREMKDSGIDYIGYIPKTWTLTKIKFCAEIFGRIGFRGYTEQDLVDYEEDGAITLSPSNFHDMKMDYKKCTYLSWRKYEESPEIMINNGDVLLVKTGSTYGKAVYVTDLPKEATINPQLIVFKNIKTDSKLFSYILQTKMIKIQTELAVVGGTIPTMSQEKIYNFILPEIPESEQQKILIFIDKECDELDCLISDIQSQIEVLEEYKRSVVTEAVTKGLDPDVEMRDSGDEWIGKIPKHWKTIRIGRLFHLRNEKNHLPMDQVQLLSLYTDIGVFPHGEHEERGNKAVTVDGYSIVKKNDIVVNIILAWMGAMGISNYDGVTSPAYDVYVPDLTKVVPHFFHYVFRTSGIAGECYKYGRGIMMMRWRTYSSEFKLINVPYPNLEEQQLIADYLDNKCAEIDAIIAEKKLQIETIEEYKKSLIFEYVTGKKEVL